MKAFRKLTALLLACAVALPTAVVQAQETTGQEPALPVLERFASISGKFMGGEPRADGTAAILFMETADGEPVHFVIDSLTCVLTEGELTEGAEIIGFYDGSAPMLLIYPPQYRAEAIVGVVEGESVKYSVFDENYLSADGMLKLNVSPETKVMLQDGTAFADDFRGRRVLVVYSATTRSIPPQTAPDLVIVLFERAQPVETPVEMPAELPTEPSVGEAGEWSLAQLQALSSDDVMIKLRPALAAAGLEQELVWDAPANRVRIGNLSLMIGSPTVEVDGISVSLSAAPQIINGSTYAPLDFFTTVLPLLRIE